MQQVVAIERREGAIDLARRKSFSYNPVAFFSTRPAGVVFLFSTVAQIESDSGGG